MNNKDMPESERLLLAEIQQLEKKLSRQHRSDLREFTKSALQGLCANNYYTGDKPESIAELAVSVAEAALAEMERRP